MVSKVEFLRGFGYNRTIMADFFSYCRLQVGCLVFMLYVGFLMIKTSDKNQKCNVFSDLLFFVGEICIVFDAITAWSVNRTDIVSPFANIILHGIFYILLESELWIMYFYFRSIANRLPKSRAQKIFFVVLILSIMGATIAFLPGIKIIRGSTTNYSYGVSVYIVFSLVPLLLAFIGVFGRKYVRNAEPVKQLTFISCFVTVSFLTVIQFIYPESLITSLNVSLIAISVALNSENPMIHRLEQYKKKSEMEKKYYDRLDEIEQRQSIIRHDEKHYLAAIGGLCAEGKIEDIEKLLKVMDIELQKNTPKKYVRNRIANALFNEKESLALRQNVKIDFQIEPEVDFENIKEIDIIAMFGNLIDNAVRAEQEWIDAHDGDCSSIAIKLFETEGNFIMFVVENHFMNIETKNGKIISTKKLPGEHGIGMFNVRSLCDSYGGVFDIEIDGELFIASICLPKNTREKVFVNRGISNV